MTQLINDSIERPEPHPAPEWCERVCADFPVMESGAPKYRVFWAPDRRRVMNIINPDTGQIVHREYRKYPGVGERWIIETLIPWEIFGRWNERAFGPKPPDGEYCLSHIIQFELVKMMQEPANEKTIFMSLDDFGSDNLRLILHCIEKSRALQAWQIRNYDQALLDLEEKEFHAKFENVYDDNRAELEKLEKLQEKAGVLTSLDPLPAPIAKERRRKARKQGKTLIH